MPPARIEQSNNKMPQTVRTILTTFISTSQFQSAIPTPNTVALPIIQTNISKIIYILSHPQSIPLELIHRSVCEYISTHFPPT